MASPCPRLFLCACLLGPAQFILAQQAVSPAGSLASEAAIETARLRSQTVPPADVNVDANGTALAVPELVACEDDSMGAQRILKAQEPVRAFAVTGGGSVVYTDNVALTRRATRDDVFAIVDAGIGWTPHVAKDLDANLSFHAALFRYDRTPELDFDNLSFGAGLSYGLPKCGGAVLFGRYDFTELLDRDGHQILMDHSLSLGIQKSLVLGRSHAVSFGAIGTLGFSDPDASRRNQAGGFVGYHLQLARCLETDLTYRPAAYFYPEGGRTDFNQILSWSLRYRFTDWAELNAVFSYALNRSDHSVFDYELLTTGASAGIIIRF